MHSEKDKLIIAAIAALGITTHLLSYLDHRLSFLHTSSLYVVLTLGGVPLVYELFLKLLRRQFGSDLLAGISIVTSILLGEYLAGSFVVLMLSGGEALEEYALKRASSVLSKLADRMPLIAHRIKDSQEEDIPIEEIVVGDLIEIHPHEIVPVDGIVAEGRGKMDESYLTGEPYKVEKVKGSHVISGAINGESALSIIATSHAKDSRYSKIIQVMNESNQSRPQIRKIGDQIGAWYTPLALIVASLAWSFSGEASRFLAVLVVATPCPVLIAIPTALIGVISLSAKRGIIIKDPVVLERAPTCRTLIFDKTGTLTYGEPELVETLILNDRDGISPLALAASLEVYSKHPLAEAVVNSAKQNELEIPEATEIKEPPGRGLIGKIGEYKVEVTGRKHLSLDLLKNIPPQSEGLECIVVVNSIPSALLRFRDKPRADSAEFIAHLSENHKVSKVMIVSGDRESEVRYLADLVGISEIYSSQSPEQKVEIIKRETKDNPTIFLGDGVNDAPALLQATVGIAMGQRNEVTSEAAGAVILDASLTKVDEFLHISKHLRRIVLQSAIGGMAVSVIGMFAAAAGYLPPVAGAITQELIDLCAVLNALRASFVPSQITDFNTKIKSQ